MAAWTRQLPVAALALVVLLPAGCGPGVPVAGGRRGRRPAQRPGSGDPDPEPDLVARRPGQPVRTPAPRPDAAWCRPATAGWRSCPARGPVSGPGEPAPYVVEVEGGLGVDPAGFAREVERS